MWGALTHTYLCINLPFIYKQKISICRTCERLFRLADSSRLWASLNAHFACVWVCVWVCACLLGRLTVGNKHANLFDFMLRYYLQFHCVPAYSKLSMPTPAPTPRPASSPSTQHLADQDPRTHAHARVELKIPKGTWHFVVWVEVFVYSCTLKSK